MLQTNVLCAVSCNAVHGIDSKCTQEYMRLIKFYRKIKGQKRSEIKININNKRKNIKLNVTQVIPYVIHVFYQYKHQAYIDSITNIPFFCNSSLLKKITPSFKLHTNRIVKHNYNAFFPFGKYNYIYNYSQKVQSIIIYTQRTSVYLKYHR